MDNIGLILEGGAMRGVYTAGVLDLFLDKNIEINYVLGVSAGACHAFSYISKQKGRNIKISKDYIRDHRYLSYRNLLKEKSIFGMKFMFDDIPNRLVPFDYETYESSKQNFIITVTNCLTGEAEYLSGKDRSTMLKICQASSSMPLLAPEVFINDIPYLDGGVADPIPIEKSIADGNEKHIIVLTRNLGYRKQASKYSSWLIKKMYKNYHGLIKAYDNRYKKYNQTLDLIEKLERENKVFVIRPTKPIMVKRTERNIQKLNNLYLDGYEDAANCMDRLLEYIGS